MIHSFRERMVPAFVALIRNCPGSASRTVATPVMPVCTRCWPLTRIHAPAAADLLPASSYWLTVIVTRPPAVTVAAFVPMPSVGSVANVSGSVVV